MIASFKKFLAVAAYFAVAAGIIRLGWEQPIHYRFMSAQEKDAIGEAKHPAPPPKPALTPWRPTRTLLGP